MSKKKSWQAQAEFPGGGTFIFGTSGSSLPAALLKAYRVTAEVPDVASGLTLTRLYSRHHPLRPYFRHPPGRRYQP